MHFLNVVLRRTSRLREIRGGGKGVSNGSTIPRALVLALGERWYHSLLRDGNASIISTEAARGTRLLQGIADLTFLYTFYGWGLILQSPINILSFLNALYG